MRKYIMANIKRTEMSPETQERRFLAHEERAFLRASFAVLANCQLIFASCFRQWQVSGPAAAANDNFLPLGFCGNARFMKDTKGAMASKLRESSGINRGVVRSLTSRIDTRYHCLWRNSLAAGWLGQKPCG